MRFRNLRLKKLQIWALSVQVLMLLAGFCIWTWLDFQEIERRARKEVENSSWLLEEHVLRSFTAIDGVLLRTADLVNELGLVELRSERAWKRLVSIAELLPISGVILIHDLNGDAIAVSFSHPAPTLNVSDREYFQDLLTRKSDFHISKALEGRSVKRSFFSVARSIPAADGTLQAIAQVGVDIDYLADLFTKVDLKGETFSIYRLSDGAAMARHPSTEQLLNESIASSSYFSTLSEGNPSWTGWVSADRDRHLLTARRVVEYPLILTVTMPYEDVFAHGFAELAWRGLLLLVAIGALTTLGIMLFRSMTHEEQTLKALQEAHERHELVLAGAQSGIWDWDVARHKVEFSPRWKSMRGFAEHEISVREEEWSQSIHPADAPRVMAGVREHFEGKTPVFAEEYRVQRKDGSWMWVSDRGIAKWDVNGHVVRMAGSEVDITERKQAEAALQEAKEGLERAVKERTVDLVTANSELENRAEQLRWLAGELTMTEQRERKRLAKILHDGLQQYLVAAKMQIDGLIHPANAQGTNQAATHIENLLTEAVKVSRSLAAELSPPILHDAGLLAGLEWLSRWMSDKHGLTVELEMERMDAPMVADDVKVFLFEAVRELLLNAVKHAKTQNAKIHFSHQDSDNLRITVSDAGNGFDVSAITAGDKSSGGLGLFSIKERISLIGGKFEYDSSPGKGARFTLTAPLSAHVQEHQESRRVADRVDGERASILGKGKIRIILTDDHVVMREGLARLLVQEPDFEVVGQANNSYEAISMAASLKPDVLLMDISMPGMSGIEATKLIHQQHPDIRIIGLSLYMASERAKEMLDAGASFFISKSGPAADLKAAIRSCMQEKAAGGIETHAG